MLISLSILPIILSFGNGVISVDLYKSKRVPRRHTEVTRTYNANHPPILENYENIPVTVIYEDQDVIGGRRKNAKKLGGIEDEKHNFNYSNSGSIGINSETRSVNHPPSVEILKDSIPDGLMNDYDVESLLKPRARSININRSTSNEKSQKSAAPGEMERKTKRSKSQQIRKVKMNKNQLEMYVNETVSSVNEAAKALKNEPENEKTKTVSDQTVTDELSSKISKSQDNPKRRKQLREPVVPIIESESYVFSHSGDFHYSYEGGDGTKAFEKGELKSSNGGSGSAVDGGFSYKDKDGNDFSLTYTADENGYRPIGAHLPTPPPIPPAIQRALDFLATKTTPEPVTERVKSIKNI